ncbi:hypothetical protein NCS52_00420200 [Fusarium sp. LHS14.1]|nr:hypothetical protein NCS52_00420200 [Fusarium sp. LHS14.1]
MDAPASTHSPGTPTDAEIQLKHAYEVLAAAARQSPPPRHGIMAFGNYPAVHQPWLQRMISILDTRGQLTHVAWGKALEELQKIVLLPEEPSAFLPLDILSAAKKACIKDLEHLSDFIHQSVENPMLLLNKQRPVSGWSAQCMVRIVGTEASQEDNSNWWLTSSISESVEKLCERAWISIHLAQDRFMKTQALCRGPNDFVTGREYAIRGLDHMMDFVHLHQNGQVVARVECFITELQQFIRAKGVGGHLRSF